MLPLTQLKQHPKKKLQAKYFLKYGSTNWATALRIDIIS